MQTTWNLNHLYEGLDDKRIEIDSKTLFDQLALFSEWCNVHLVSKSNPVKTINTYFDWQNKTYPLASKLIAFPELISAVDTQNMQAVALSNNIQNQLSNFSGIAVQFSNFVATLDRVDSVISQLSEGRKNLCLEIIENNKYMLSEQEEILISKMKQSGSQSWTNLYSQLTSELTFTVTENKETKTLPLAAASKYMQSPDRNIRRDVYHSVNISRKSIAKPLSIALQAIKKESVTTNQLRGYKSIVQEVALDSRLSEEILNNLWQAVASNKLLIQRYFKAKAKKLGQTKLSPYDMFAPLGESENYSLEKAQATIISSFEQFSPKLASIALKAFDENLIDYYPRSNKRAGAFCYSIYNTKKSYVMLNFNENITDVITLAHELGHAYHGMIMNESEYSLSKYTLPLAETASNLAERIVKESLLKEATNDEKTLLLDSALMDFSISTLIIYARFLFEQTTIEKVASGEILTDTELSQIENDIYIDLLGDSFNHEENMAMNWVAILHHYYHDYYNFPYAFGLLYSSGLYEQYLENNSKFVENYDEMLTLTGYAQAKSVAQSLSIDIESIAFWDKAMKSFEQMVSDFETI